MGVVMANSRRAFTKVPGLPWVGMGALLFPGPGPGKPPRLHSQLQGPVAQLSSGSGATLKASSQLPSLLGGNRQFKKRKCRQHIRTDEINDSGLSQILIPITDTV